MKKLTLCSALVVMYLLFSAKSCDSGEQSEAAREKNRIKTAKDSIVNNFGSESLSGEALKAFEETARLRFRDFADYYSVLNNVSAAREFRTHAGEMITDLFVSGNTVLLITDPEKHLLTEKISLKEFIDKALDGRNKQFTLAPDSVWITQKLYSQGDSVYTGKLAFSSSALISVKTPFASGNAEFFVLKREKRFGKEKLNAWTVVLGQTEFKLSSPAAIVAAK